MEMVKAEGLRINFKMLYCGRLRPFSHHRMLKQLVEIVGMCSVELRQLLALVMEMVGIVVMILVITKTADEITLAVMVMVMTVVGFLVRVLPSINIVHFQMFRFQLQVTIHQLYVHV